MTDETYTELIEQYLAGTLTSTGKAELARLMDQPEYRDKLEMLMEDAFKSEVFVDQGNEKLGNEIQEWLKEKIAEEQGAKIIELSSIGSKEKPLVSLKRWHRIAAASVILIVGIIVYRLEYNKKRTQTKEIASINKDSGPVPGKYKAKLMLADSSVVILDDHVQRKLLQQGNIAVINDVDHLLLKKTDSGADEVVLTYTLFTSRGETYSMVMSDGTKVWLNAESSIKFPNFFAGKERRVEITGEAYFEVEHDPAKPFHVTVNGMDVQDLGTHFNINAYDDDPRMTTTLIEGKLKVSKNGATALLSPGSQAIVKGKNDLKTLKNVNTDQVIAWQQGVFNFDQMALKDILRQIARWYDVEVIYETEIPDKKYFFVMNRNSEFKAVLEALKVNNIKFRTEGKKLIITR